MSFKAAHRLVAQTIKRLPDAEADCATTVETLLSVARESLGRPLNTPRQKLEAALCPVNFVTVRKVIGGPAPKTVEKFLDEQDRLANEDQKWRRSKAALLAAFPQRINRRKKTWLA